jgi:hypothetical protein
VALTSSAARRSSRRGNDGQNLSGGAGGALTAQCIGPFIATISYLLAPVGDGTQLINVVDLEPASAASRLLAPLATSRVKAAVAANLNTLKQLLEAGSQGAPG